MSLAKMFPNCVSDRTGNLKAYNFFDLYLSLVITNKCNKGIMCIWHETFMPFHMPFETFSYLETIRIHMKKLQKMRGTPLLEFDRSKSFLHELLQKLS